MKALTTVAMYGLVPVPPIQDAQALGKNDDQPPMAETRTPHSLHGIGIWRRMTRSRALGSNARAWTPICRLKATPH